MRTTLGPKLRLVWYQGPGQACISVAFFSLHKNGSGSSMVICAVPDGDKKKHRSCEHVTYDMKDELRCATRWHMATGLSKVRPGIRTRTCPGCALCQCKAHVPPLCQKEVFHWSELLQNISGGFPENDRMRNGPATVSVYWRSWRRRESFLTPAAPRPSLELVP
jgi:hypothetical protein